MKRKQINVRLGFDFKDRSGNWVKSFRFSDKEEYVAYIYHTKLSLLWASVVARCKEGGSYQRNRNTYIGVKNHFTYQELGDWVQSQEGYNNFNKSGRTWNLDKDILGDGKIYSKEVCCFVPDFVNVLFTLAGARRGEFPLGVSKQQKCKGFIARCHNNIGNGESINLGSYNTPEEAHAAYQGFKAATIRESAERYIALKGSREDVYYALLQKADRLLRDKNEGVETKTI